MSEFLIRRPIVAIVISILMVIIGAITIVSLPVAQFPDIAPPEIRLQALYPGADAETMEKAVATPIEQQINGVDNMDYMYSLNSTNNSSTTLMVDFDLKTDPNMDLILAQSRQQLANGQTSPRGQPDRHRREEVLDLADDAGRLVLAQRAPTMRSSSSNYGYINCQGADRALLRCRTGPDLWHRRVRDADLGKTRSDWRSWVSPSTKSPMQCNRRTRSIRPVRLAGEPAATASKFTYAVRAQGRLHDAGRVWRTSLSARAAMAVWCA